MITVSFLQLARPKAESKQKSGEDCEGERKLITRSTFKNTEKYIFNSVLKSLCSMVASGSKC